LHWIGGGGGGARGHCGGGGCGGGGGGARGDGDGGGGGGGGLMFASFFTLSDNITRGYCFKIQKQYSRVNCRAFSC